MKLDSVLKTFINECRELLDDMEASLLQLEQGESEDLAETLNAIFRTAHTIKGSAGLFSLDNVVAFTHTLESVLDRLRAGNLRLSDELITSLFQARDHMSALVDEVERGSAGSDQVLQQQGSMLEGVLHQFLEASNASANSQKTGAGKAMARVKEHLDTEANWQMSDNNGGKLERIEDGSVCNDCWHISLRFGEECFRAGLDPLSFIRYLEGLGSIRHIVTLADGLPEWSLLNPESCHLGFEIKFESDASKQAIEDVFEFAREDAQIRILPPHSRLREYIELIEKMPEVDLRIGELLLECGALTQTELDAALRFQGEGQSGDSAKCLGEILVEGDSTLSPVLEAAVSKQQHVRENIKKETNSLRVDAEKLDTLINLVGELVTAGAGTALRAQASGSGELIESVSVLTGLLEEVRDAALRLRMVQIGATFNRFQRIVRDISRELNKDIELRISGADTELDKTLVERIGDPLMHLVRNAIDHGIETADERQRRGKPVQGTVTLNAFHDSGSIVIEVSDDGKGLNSERIRAKAIAKGMISEDAVLSREEILNLIFEPGFSTADEVSNLSGRGVGMDVVKRNIGDLRGRVELESVEGKGTTIRLYMPLTLAIIDGFLIGVNESAFVLPLDAIVECVELPPQTQSQERSKQANYLNLRGEVLPLIFLRDSFALQGVAPRRQNVVVVQSAGQSAGLVVDRLLGELQTVIKPLGRIFDSVNGIGGSTILGNGEAALILDIPKLVQQVTSREQGTFGAVH